MLKELRPSPKKEVQDTVLSSLKRDASLQKSLCKISSHSEKKLSTLEQRLSKLNRVYKQEKFHEKEYINKLKLKDIKINNLSSMVKAQLKELEKQHESREQEQKEIEQAQLKRKKRQNALHQKRRSQELEVKSNRLEDLESSARINKQNAELQAEKQSLTITLEACQSESRKQAEIIQNLKRELKSLKQQNSTHLKTQAECQKEMTSYKLTENMLKSQLAELKKEKKLWETTKNTDCDQTNLKVTLTDPFFQIGSDHAFFVGHPSRSKSFMMNDIGSGGLKKTQLMKVHQSSKNINFALINGDIVEKFKNDIYPSSKVQAKRGPTGTKNYGFPRIIDEEDESLSDSMDNEIPISMINSGIEPSESEITDDQAKEIEEMMNNKYSVFNAFSINLEEFSLSKPRYFTLIEHHISSGEAFKGIYEEMDEKTRRSFELEKQTLLRRYRSGTLELPYNPPFDQWLFVTIRAIFDSKMYEHCMKSHDPTNITSFPEFVYSWLGTFCVDGITRKTRLLEFYELDHVDEIRLQILLGLKANIESKMWEYSLFLDFLEERHSVDELHFYLLCRDYVFGGSQLSTRKGQFDRVHLIPMEVAISVFKQIFTKAPNEEVTEIRERLFNLSKGLKINQNKRPSKSYIDATKILRIMLEYYRKEKKIRVHIFHELFEEKLQITKTTFQSAKFSDGISFQHFKSILQQLDPDCSHTESASIYRLAWVLGNNCVNLRSFMKAANTRNYFVRNINIEASYDVPQSMTKFLKLDQNLRSLATTVGNEDAYLAVNKLLLSIKERAGYKLDSEVLTQFRSLNLIFHNMKNVLLRNTSQNNSRQHVMTNEFIEKELKIYKNLVIQFKEYYEEKQEDPEGELVSRLML
ncbi:unnamed protein product [Moneuplotes crassus]|uniref:Uncharacterized protein n=1 Tax=Euplotes crassus TaxID=5936 RepID=A0AAD1UCM1_EUPCR|nr:unnamed protein product [Moneuplotes crassus]